MQVEVVGHDGDELVELRCGPMTFRARWDSNRPEVGSSHDIELDVAEVLRWSRDIYAIDDPTAAQPHQSELIGQVADLSADGRITIDVVGTMLEVDTTGSGPVETGQWVSPRPRGCDGVHLPPLTDAIPRSGNVSR